MLGDHNLFRRKFIGYAYYQTEKLVGGITYYHEENGNASCPWVNISKHCRSSWKNTTDQITGKAQGPGNSLRYYDPRWRPWYKKSMEAGQAVWSSLYVFAGAGTGITATVPINIPGGRQIGVVGIDCTYYYWTGPELYLLPSPPLTFSLLPLPPASRSALCT